MNFQDYLKLQLNLHSSMQPQDFIKMCYQAAKGAEHLLSDIDSAKQYFDKEFNQTERNDTLPLYEEISSNICRINLGAWKSTGMPSEWLFCMFTQSAHVSGSIDGSSSKENDLLETYLGIVDTIMKTWHVSFSYAEWQSALDEYKKQGMSSIHHSSHYREIEKPAYRIVQKRFLKLIPILERASSFLERNKKTALLELSQSDTLGLHSVQPIHTNTICIAIDGRAASGKSTMAHDLKTILNGGLIHIDDFFLPPSLRIPSRLAEIGGNVHYERFHSEVLPLLGQSNAFSYQTFDCSKMDYGAERFVEESLWRIVEGAYSHHPYFGSYADIKVFSDISPEMQMERIKKRNGEQMAKRFQKEWIPMEESYYNYYQIKENADIIISN